MLLDHSLLQTLVPINSLTVDHLNTLLRDVEAEPIFGGQELFAVGDRDNQHVFLLSGSVSISTDEGSVELDASDLQCRYPLCHYQPRRNTVSALSDCIVVRFNSDKLDAMLAWDQAADYILLDIASQRDLDEDADWMATLLKSNLFYKVPPMNIRQIIDRFKARYVNAGDVILRQGEEGDSCYFIKEGIAEVHQSPDGKQPQALVAELEPGRCFGEDALVNDDVRNATIMMKTNGVLMRLDKNDFFLLLKSELLNEVSFSEAYDNADDSQWLDVRSQDEFERGHIKGAINMPLNLLKLKSRMLANEKSYMIYCNSGRRSEAATRFLKDEGYQVSWISGGLMSCSEGEKSLLGISGLMVF